MHIDITSIILKFIKFKLFIKLKVVLIFVDEPKLSKKNKFGYIETSVSKATFKIRFVFYCLVLLHLLYVI